MLIRPLLWCLTSSDRCFNRTLDYMSSIQNSEVVFDYMEPEAFSEDVRSAVSSRLALQRFFARTDFVPSKTSISRRSRPGSAAPFKDSRPDTLVFMLSTLNTN